jgi:hypothetical protein
MHHPQWLAAHNTSPMTNEVLASRALVANYAIRRVIDDVHEAQQKAAAATALDASSMSSPLASESASQVQKPQGSIATSATVLESQVEIHRQIWQGAVQRYNSCSFYDVGIFVLILQLRKHICNPRARLMIGAVFTKYPLGRFAWPKSRHVKLSRSPELSSAFSESVSSVSSSVVSDGGSHAKSDALTAALRTLARDVLGKHALQIEWRRYLSAQ